MSGHGNRADHGAGSRAALGDLVHDDGPRALGITDHRTASVRSHVGLAGHVVEGGHGASIDQKEVHDVEVH